MHGYISNIGLSRWCLGTAEARDLYLEKSMWNVVLINIVQFLLFNPAVFKIMLIA